MILILIKILILIWNLIPYSSILIKIEIMILFIVFLYTTHLTYQLSPKS